MELAETKNWIALRRAVQVAQMSLDGAERARRDDSDVGRPVDPVATCKALQELQRAIERAQTAADSLVEQIGGAA